MRERKAAVSLFVVGLNYDRLLVRCGQLENALDMGMDDLSRQKFMQMLERFNTKFNTRPREAIMDVLAREKLEQLAAQRARWQAKLRSSDAGKRDLDAQFVDVEGAPGLDRDLDDLMDFDEMPDVAEAHDLKRQNDDETTMEKLNESLVGLSVVLAGEKAVTTRVNRVQNGFEVTVRNDQGAEVSVDVDSLEQGLIEAGLQRTVVDRKLDMLKRGVIATPQPVRRMRQAPLLPPTGR